LKFLGSIRGNRNRHPNPGSQGWCETKLVENRELVQFRVFGGDGRIKEPELLRGYKVPLSPLQG
jgi:hypothetical protein